MLAVVSALALRLEGTDLVPTSFDEALFPGGVWEETWDGLAKQREFWGDAVRGRGSNFSPENFGKRNIPIDDPSEYPRPLAWDYNEDDSLFYTFRPNLIGQEVDDEWDYFNLVATDRPDYTDATYTVGQGVTVFESGYTYRRAVDPASGLRETTRTLPELLYRYGLTDELELRFRWDGYALTDVQDRPRAMSGQIFGQADLTLSGKYEIWQQSELRPMLTIVSGFTVPTGSPEITANAVQPYANLVAGWGLRRWIYLKIGASAEWQRSGSLVLQVAGGGQPIGPLSVSDRDNRMVCSTSVSLQFQVSKRFGGYTEVFSFGQLGSADNRGSTYFDTGICYYATPNIQFDGFYGTRISDAVDELFTGGGISFRY